MPITRSFDDVLAVFRASKPKGKLKSFPDLHYDALAAYSFGDLSRWPKSPPVNTLVRPKSGFEVGSETLTSARALVEYAHFGNAIGTWNANGEAAFVRGEGWILATVDLTQEQADDGYEGPGDFVGLLVALWQVSDGWAAAVLDQGARELAVRLLGLDAWPASGWQTESVWYGE